MHCWLLQKIPYCKKVDSLAADELVKPVKIVFTEFGFPQKLFQMQAWTSYHIHSDNFCRQINIKQAIEGLKKDLKKSTCWLD